MFLELIILVLAIPTGFLIAYLANDELVAGRKWFKSIIVASILLGVWSVSARNYIITWTCGFILITAFVSYLKSFEK